MSEVEIPEYVYKATASGQSGGQDLHVDEDCHLLRGKYSRKHISCFPPAWRTEDDWCTNCGPY